jgi:anaerobic selenocysteine-containing dehydrogenase
MQTLRSHDQFNTTIYDLNDRYRGIHQGRRVVFVHPDDIAALGLAEDQFVDLVSEWKDPDDPSAETCYRKAPLFRVVAYSQPRGCAAAYYPETNPLIPLDSKALKSNCPTSKAVIVRLVPTDERPVEGGEHAYLTGYGLVTADGTVASDAQKSYVEPEQLS